MDPSSSSSDTWFASPFNLAVFLGSDWCDGGCRLRLVPRFSKAASRSATFSSLSDIVSTKSSAPSMKLSGAMDLSVF